MHDRPRHVWARTQRGPVERAPEQARAEVSGPSREASTCSQRAKVSMFHQETKGLIDLVSWVREGLVKKVSTEPSVTTILSEKKGHSSAPSQNGSQCFPRKDSGQLYANMHSCRACLTSYTLIDSLSRAGAHVWTEHRPRILFIPFSEHRSLRSAQRV